MKSCSIEGCATPALARGLCNCHYQRWRARGRGGMDNLGPSVKPPPRRCDVPGCERPFRKNGHCNLHAQRIKRHGTPLEQTPARSALSGVCRVDNCLGKPIARDLCTKHYSRWRASGTTADPAPKPRSFCEVEGCDRESKSRSLCGKHYQAALKYGDPMVNRKKVGRSVCSIEGCGRLVAARGLCSGHYQRVQKGLLQGDVLKQRSAPIRTQGDPIAWLHSHVGHTDQACLIWPFARQRSGYGVAPVEAVLGSSVVAPGQKKIAASRAMCVLAHGDPPATDMIAAHACGNGHLGCTNPRHLRWATAVENMRDKLLHGVRTTAGGELVVNDNQVAAIVALGRTMPPAQIAAAFRVSEGLVREIIDT
jgi:hypothetical protein